MQTIEGVRRLVLPLYLLLFSCFAVAETPPSTVEGLPLEKCDWNMVWTTMLYNSSHRQAAMGQQAHPLLKEIERLASKAKIPTLPVDQQLNKEDLVKLNQAMQRNASIGFSMLLESNRDRDMDVLDHLVQIADKNYRWHTEVQQNNPDFIYQSIINDMFPAIYAPDRSMTITTPSSQTCSAQLALYKIEQEAIAKLNAMSSGEDASKVLGILKEMAERNHMTSIDRSKLLQEDQRKYDEINSEFLIPLNNELTFINNLEVIRLLSSASELIYETGKQDLLDTGGDGMKIGTTLDSKVKNNEFSQQMIKTIGLLRLIGNKIPSEKTKQNIEVGKVIKQANPPRKQM